LVVYGCVTLCGFAADLLTKYLVFAWLGLPEGRPEQHTYWLIRGYVGIQTAVNQGALFGMGQGKSLWFAVLSVVAFVGIVYWLFARRAARDLWLTVCLSMVSAGILGNLYDRLGLWHGAAIAEAFRYGVRDWILLQFQGYVWPNFNLADSLLVCGAGLLLWHAFFRRSDADNGEQRKDAMARQGAAKNVA
jgi:signal peptidase II